MSLRTPRDSLLHRCHTQTTDVQMTKTYRSHIIRLCIDRPALTSAIIAATTRPQQHGVLCVKHYQSSSAT